MLRTHFILEDLSSQEYEDVGALGLKMREAIKTKINFDEPLHTPPCRGVHKIGLTELHYDFIVSIDITHAFPPLYTHSRVVIEYVRTQPPV